MELALKRSKMSDAEVYSAPVEKRSGPETRSLEESGQ